MVRASRPQEANEGLSLGANESACHGVALERSRDERVEGSKKGLVALSLAKRRSELRGILRLASLPQNDRNRLRPSYRHLGFDQRRILHLSFSSMSCCDGLKNATSFAMSLAFFAIFAVNQCDGAPFVSRLPGCSDRTTTRRTRRLWSPGFHRGRFRRRLSLPHRNSARPQPLPCPARPSPSPLLRALRR